jgi:predicted LPLAT superfamily acyltransferase
MTQATWTERPERGSPWLIRLMFRIAIVAGRPLARVLLGPIALFFWLRTAAARADSARYLSRVLGRPAGTRDTLRHYFAFSSVILDRVYFLSGRSDMFRITVEGEPLLEDAVRSGTGVFLVGAHLGSFEALRAIGRRQPGLRVSMAMFDGNARKIMSLLQAIDPSLLDDVVPLGHIDSMMRIEERLRRGDFVGLLADRSFGNDPTMTVDFLGAPARLPTGVFRMAAVMRCPVMMMAGLYLGGDRYALHFHPLADFTHVGREARSEEVARAVRSYASRLEHYCRIAPYNWFNFYDFWASAASSPDPGNEHGRRAS